MRAPYLARIAVFPIKALDAVEVTGATITSGGSLSWDRRFAMLDRSGKYINGKRNTKVHLIRAVYDLERSQVRLRRQGTVQWDEFSLVAGEPELERWLSDHFGEPVRVEEKPDAGFPDDTEASGPTLVCAASLLQVASWFPGLDAGDLRRRFRVNLEVDGVQAFWEDLQFTEHGRKTFRIGEVELEGVNPCARCVVPARDPETSDVLPGFQRTFMERRAATLPPGVAGQRFDHFYRFTLNTVIARGQQGRSLNVGDPVVAEGSSP
jgi:uncharacterized protein YcbX